MNTRIIYIDIHDLGIYGDNIVKQKHLFRPQQTEYYINGGYMDIVIINITFLCLP
jgi:hypothetical protein